MKKKTKSAFERSNEMRSQKGVKNKLVNILVSRGGADSMAAP